MGLRVRVIPLLLLKDWGLEKGIEFDEHVYIGCATNAVRVFNNLNVDEIVLLDIVATEESRKAKLEIVKEVVEETFMPITVGGGIRDIENIRELLKAGADRVVINTASVETPELVTEGAERFGSQCMVVSIDARKRPDGSYEVYTHAGKQATGIDPVTHAREMEARGAGEILVTSIDQDGKMTGYDVELIRSVADAVTIPTIACGGAGSEEHFRQAVDEGHASAVAAGAMFVFFGRRRTVLITYPEDQRLIEALGPDRVRIKDQPGAWWP